MSATDVLRYRLKAFSSKHSTRPSFACRSTLQLEAPGDVRVGNPARHLWCAGWPTLDVCRRLGEAACMLFSPSLQSSSPYQRLPSMCVPVNTSTPCRPAIYRDPSPRCTCCSADIAVCGGGGSGAGAGQLNRWEYGAASAQVLLIQQAQWMCFVALPTYCTHTLGQAARPIRTMPCRIGIAPRRVESAPRRSHL